ncbi:protein vein isoform X2 [Onthophagus taurus]|uniref:protein vein isoform X2 n=1 Tax=Onthophagus taurus TaxID=166361 RepID=UPI000C20A29B|nr:uncharacterized protein LOC111415015 isoform X2 [Onthophagus taurus]
MYGLARCVSVMFVVIIAFLSFCSGYRIDNVLAMTDLRRQRLQTPPNTINPTNTIENTSEQPPFLLDTHKIRHSRHRHLHLQPPTTEEHLVQIPTSPPHVTSPPPTTSLSISTPNPIQLVSRIQRSHRSSSSFSKRNQRRGKGDRRKRRNTKCQLQDSFRKAAMANTVMRAKVQTQSASRKANSTYNVTFNILKVYKSREPSNHDTIRLAFAYGGNPSNCESDLGRNGLVQAKLQQSQEYYLFLNSHGSYNYTVYGLPVPVRQTREGIEAKIERVCKKGFAQLLKKPTLDRTYKKRKHKITCKAKGFPTPLIYWYKDDQRFLPQKNHKITYSRRSSTLIFNETNKNDYGRYRCQTEGLNNTIEISEDTVLDEGLMPCNKTVSAMCINGDCFVTDILGAFCVCKNNFQGQRCNEKTSTYQQNITSCNLPQYNISHFCKN